MIKDYELLRIEYELQDFYEAIVDSAFGLINYIASQKSRANNLIVFVEF